MSSTDQINEAFMQSRLKRVLNYEKSVQLIGSNKSKSQSVILKGSNKYLRMDDQLFKFFESMDGSRTTGDLMNSTIGSVLETDVSVIERFVLTLFRNDLISGSDNKDDAVLKYLHRKYGQPVPGILSRMGKMLMSYRIEWKNPDKAISVLHSLFGRYFLSLRGLILLSLIIAIGTTLAAQCLPDLISSIYNLDSFIGMTQVEHVALVMHFFLATIVHEISHALTCKHFGRQLTAFGIKLFYGMPVFFTNTSDCWMLSKGRRIAVDAAGIVANLALGSIFVVLSVTIFDTQLSQVAFLGAAMNFSIALFNLFPFLKFDGYYILTDFLERPNLREDSISLLLGFSSWKLDPISGNRPLFKTGIVLFGFCSLVSGTFAILLFSVMIYQIVIIIAPGPHNSTIALISATLLGGSFVSFAWRKAKSCRPRVKISIKSDEISCATTL